MWRGTQPNSNTSLFQSIQLVGGQNVKEAAKDQANKRHSEALNPGFCKLKKSRRYKAGDKSSYAKIAEEGCDGPLSAFKATVREQFDMLLIDTEAALAAIPSMLPDDAVKRQRAFDLICEVLTARGQHSSEDLKRVRRIGELFDSNGQLSARSNLAIASDVGNGSQARPL